MREKEKIKQELEEIAPFLARIKAQDQDNGFRVPPDYFKQLTANVLAAVEQEAVDHSSKRTNPWAWGQALWNAIWQPHLAYAFATIVCLLCIGFWLFKPVEVLPDLAFNKEELEAYVIANINDFDTDLLMEAYSETSMDALDATETEGPALMEDSLEEIIQQMDEGSFESLWEAVDLD
ncbi:MAG: hypothetical protein R2828_22440 [Saprospiraceae bacterium]